MGIKANTIFYIYICCNCNAFCALHIMKKRWHFHGFSVDFSVSSCTVWGCGIWLGSLSLLCGFNKSTKLFSLNAYHLKLGDMCRISHFDMRLKRAQQTEPILSTIPCQIWMSFCLWIHHPFRLASIRFLNITLKAKYKLSYSLTFFNLL